MTFWLNHVTVSTTAGSPHTVDPSNPTGSGTVVDGSAFTPTSGRLLVCFVAGPVTSTTPSGWTLPSGGSAVSTDGLYVFYKTAAGSDTLTTNHNSGSFRVTFDFYEFPSTASVFSAASFPAAVSGSTKTISSLTGTNLILAPVCSPTNAGSFSFTGATKHFEYNSSDSFHHYAIANVYSSASSVGVAATLANHEQLAFAVAGLADPDATVAVPVATATAAATTPAVGASYTAAPPAAAASASATSPAVTGTGDATVLAPAATASAGGPAPSPGADSTVSAPAASAAADGVAPSVSATASATVAAPVASASAGAVAPFVSNDSPDATIEAPAAHASASARVPGIGVGLDTDVSNIFNGRVRNGYATAELTIPVAPAPAGTSRGHRVDKAVPLPLPTLVNGRPT